jgi:triacylglycerol esterase/lipase EstA (alpha/beta hydrolase family)
MVFTDTHSGRVQNKSIPGVTIPVYWFDGFHFEKYNSQIDKGLKPIVVDEYSLIKNGTGTTNNVYRNVYGESLSITKADNPYIAIGHSQGGLRVLAYAAYLKQQDPVGYNKLKGVITISGIDRGLKLLDGGLPETYTRLSRKADVLKNGFKSIANISIWTMIAFTIAESLVSQEGVRNLLIDKVLPDKFQFIKSVSSNINTPDNIPQIRDMIPNSDFMQQSVVSKKENVYKMYAGTQSVLVPRIIPQGQGYTIVFERINIPIYRIVARWYSDEMRFGSDLPVGYIVGTDNNTFEMAGADMGIINNLYNVFDKGYQYWHVLDVLFGWFIDTPGENAQKAGNAKKFCANIKTEINDLIGETSHDGLVAASSQYFPASIHANFLGITEVKLSHEAIVKPGATETWKAVDRMIKHANTIYESK